MRVVQFVGQQLRASLHQNAVGARRQGHDARIGADRLDQQGALSSAVEHPNLASSVEHDKTLAALFGDDLANGAVAHLEVADVLEALFVIRVTGHKPLADVALGVADHQRNAAQQLSAGGDFGAGVLKQFITAIEVALGQVEHVQVSTTVEHEQPVLPRIDVHRLDRLGQLRQLDLGFGEGCLTGKHVFFLEQRQHMQLIAAGAGQHQAVFMHAQIHVFQRAALGINLQRRNAVGELQLRGDGFLTVRIGRLVSVAQNQGLAVGQAHGHQRAARLALLQRSHLGAGRQRQAAALEFGTGFHGEEQRFALGGNAQTDLVLLFHRQQQRLTAVLQPGRALGRFGTQFGALEQWHNHIGQVEEDQGNGRQHGEAADEHIPAGQVVFQRAQTALALQFRRIEINPRGRSSSHGRVGQIVHANTLTALYDKKMTEHRRKKPADQ